MADHRIELLEEEIDWLERPEMAVAGMLADQPVTGAGIPWPLADDYYVRTDALKYCSRGRISAFNGFYNPREWRSGIYHAGVTVSITCDSTIDSIRMNLVVEDQRGSRRANTYVESIRQAQDHAVLRGKTCFNLSMLFEVYSIRTVNVSALMNATGSGALTIDASSTMWIHRVRGLSDV
jgi:hypothetical protein